MMRFGDGRSSEVAAVSGKGPLVFAAVSGKGPLVFAAVSGKGPLVFAAVSSTEHPHLETFEATGTQH